MTEPHPPQLNIVGQSWQLWTSLSASDSSVALARSGCSAVVMLACLECVGAKSRTPTCGHVISFTRLIFQVKGRQQERKAWERG